jgi:hypothetical protein
MAAAAAVAADQPADLRAYRAKRGWHMYAAVLNFCSAQMGVPP